MKYTNASDVLPDALLKELQKYAQGELLYIPQGTGRKQWGSGTGARQYYAQRNDEIRYKYYSLQAPAQALAEEYALTEETIRKILYK